jgi:polyhydroxybutyrate depolymerase
LVIAVVPSTAGAETPSSGCRVEPPVAAPTTFEVDGLARQAILVVPDDPAAGPQSLVFAFHGRTNANTRARRYFGLEKAGHRPTIFVYPAGLRDASGGFTWFEPGDHADGLRDLAFFDVMLESIAASYCVDLDEAFVVGHSLGASFAIALACARSKEIRGVAAVAGGMPSSQCAGEVAALLIHNPKDRLVPVAEGERARDTLLAAGSRDTGREEILRGFRCTRFADEGNPLLWCRHHQDRTSRGRFYPHQWPQGAGATIMGFFEGLSERR